MKTTTTGGRNGGRSSGGTRVFVRVAACVGAWVLAPAAWGQTLISCTKDYSVGTTLRDLEDPPQVYSVTVSGSGIARLTELKVGLKLVGATSGGGFASEMVVMLTKDLTKTSVLLNQVGVGVGGGAGALIGYGYDGWDVTFADGAVRGDVHGYDIGSGVMTGEVAPDGRIDPTSAARPGMLSVMNNQAGDGLWSLSVADLGVGGVMRVEGWSLMMTGWTPVPEPGVWGAVVGVGLCVWGTLRRGR